MISWPHTLIFEVTQRDCANYNSSEQLDFPFQLCYEENGISIEYTTTPASPTNFLRSRG